MSTPKIATLMTGADTVEQVRDAVAAILALESENQATLADAAGENPADWQLRVFVERSDPWSDWLDPEADDIDPTPVANVWVDSENFNKTGSDVGQQRGRATINVDLFAIGFARDNYEGQIASDREASFNVQRAARVVRRILMHAAYQYLGATRGASQVVLGRFVSDVQFFQPPGDVRAIQRICGARLRLEVDLIETCSQVVGDVFEGLTLSVFRDSLTGQVLLKASYPDDPPT